MVRIRRVIGVVGADAFIAGAELMVSSSATRVGHYLMSFPLVLAAWTITSLLRTVNQRVVYFGFFAAIVCAAFVGGWKTATLTLVLSLGVITYYFLDPVYSFDIQTPDLISLAAFSLLAGLIIGLDEARKNAIRRYVAMVEERDQTLVKLERYKKLVPYCVECQEYFEDDAYWSEMGTYLETLARRPCLCSKCVKKIFV
jgi:K+-sensing histidine kinase KdpD